MKLKLFFYTVIIFFLLSGYAGAFELDESVDSEIRQKYNTSKLEQDVLPALPQVLKEDSQKSITEKSEKPKLINNNPISEIPKNNIDTDYATGFERVKSEKKALVGGDSYTEIKVPKGTKFKVRSKTNLSDKNAAGAGMTFVSTIPVTKRFVSFPTGTTFKGYIEDSHQPNYAGNGGLLKLKINSISYNGTQQNIDAKVVRANNKVIFFNNIKGKRGYLKGIAANVKKGETFYQKTRQTSSRLSNNPVGTIISPIPTIIGAAGYGVNLVASPVTALWSKGSGISLPSGTDYTIKLRSDSYIYK